MPQLASLVGRSGLVLAQTVAIVAAWLTVVILYRNNDGLWYVGDAARHALNGLFWSDLLSALPRDPKEYVLRYYARYPAITPVSYPPAFYLLEALAFGAIAPKAFVAKGLVLGFSLAAALCLAAWLRRYVSRDAGWGGVLLLLQPGTVVWSNAVMLNLPAMALGLITLYVARRWIEAPTARGLLLTLGFGAWTALTYFPAVLVVIVSWLWLAGEGRWRRLWLHHRGLVLVAIAAPIVVALLLIGRVPLPFALAYSTLAELWNADKWLYYLYVLPKVVSPLTLGLAVLAVPAALREPRRRRDVRLLTVWIVVTYVGLSYLWSREPRYALLFMPAVVMLAMIGLHWALARVAVPAFGRQRSVFAPALMVLLLFQGRTALTTRFPSIDGFRDVARFVVDEAPTERVLYEGHYDGTFTFYMRAQDPAYRRAVVRGSKLLYASAIQPMHRLTERVASVADVMRVLDRECGCGWIVVERAREPAAITAGRLLREALQGPRFRLVRSFPVQAARATHVDVYELLGSFATPAQLSLPFPFLGDDIVYHAQPITR